VRREHLIATGKQVRLKEDIKCFVTSLEAGADEYHFSFYVISAAPRTVVESALEASFLPTTSTARSARMTRPPAKSVQSRRSPRLREGRDPRGAREPAADQPGPDVYVGDGSSMST